MNHEHRVESGHALGGHVHWVRCTCGWIGTAAGTEHGARQAAQQNHPQGNR